VLLADEPTGNLDEGTRDEIISLLEDQWRSRGLTLVLVTHDSAVAARAQRIGLMKDGHLTTSHTGSKASPGPGPHLAGQRPAGTAPPPGSPDRPDPAREPAPGRDASPRTR
jgi:putative ABC transport system ATP-binding protein